MANNGAIADKVIDVPGMGTVSFPGSMTDDQVNAAIYSQLNPEKAAVPAEENPELAQVPGSTSGNYPVREGVSEANALANIAALGMGGESPMGMPHVGFGEMFAPVRNAIAGIARKIGADSFADYFVDPNGNGHYTPTSKMTQIQQIHEALGVKPGDLDMGLGTSTLADARNLQGRALLEAGIKPQDLKGLNPFEQTEKIAPFWEKAGQAVDDTAAAATKRGVKLDVGKGLSDTIGNMLDPQGTQALARATDIARQVGIKNWRTITPEQAVAFKRALWQGMPARFRGPVYGAITRDLNEAVPEMKPINQNYAELRAVMDTLADSQAKFMSRASPTKFSQFMDFVMKNRGVLTGGGIGGGVLANQLYDWWKNK